MRTNAWIYGSVLLVLCVSASTQAQSRTDVPGATAVATANPILRVTTEYPREINLGKPATFVICVANQGKMPATGVLVATSIPEHVELTNSEPKQFKVEGGVHKFQVGDLEPGATRCVTLVTVPRTTDPIKLDSTVVFATSTRSSVVVRRPLLTLAVEAPPQVAIGTKVDWSVRVTNTGDGLAEDVVVTPSLVDGEVQGKPLQQAVKIGPLKPGETKEVQYTVVPSCRGKVTARFVGSNPDGLEASQESTVQALQAELAVEADGPRVQPMSREGVYEIRVTNPGDATTGSTLVTAKVPAGLKVTHAAENAYHEETRTLRWRITAVRPSDVVRMPFRAETTAEGEQTLSIAAESEAIPSVSTTHTTTVISRPNPIVTVVNAQEFSAVGTQIGFEVNVLNAGSKPADDLRVRVSIPEDLEAVDSDDYQVTGGQIEFPAQKLASGEKLTLAFRVVGRRAGEHRVRVLVDGAALSSELVFEGSAYCYLEYLETDTPTERTAERESPETDSDSWNR